MLTIETTRFSAVIKSFVEQFPTAEVKLDGQSPAGPLESWCTNKNLKAAINFSLVNNGNEVLGFHDGPRNMWASDETLALVQILAEKKILRFEEAIYIHHDKQAAIRNTAIYSVFLVLFLVVLITRESWFARIVMLLPLVWALGGVTYNWRAIRKGFVDLDNPES